MDARGCLVTPGLVNTRHHLFQNLTRCYAPALNGTLFEWLSTLYPLWAGLNEESAYLSAWVGRASGPECHTGAVRAYGLRFDVNCSILFTELPLLERPAAAKAAGFDAVEFWWPFESCVPDDSETDAFVSAITGAGVELVSLNFHTGNMAAGERGILSDPARARDFRDNIAAVAEVARRTGCTRLNAPYGNRLPGTDPAEQDAVATENLTLAARAAEEIGATVLVEAINSVDVPAFPVDTSDKAAAVIDRVPAGNVAFLADLYHLAKAGESLPEVLTRHAGRIAHVQVADPPGRGAPGTGTLDFEPLLKQLSESGYAGWVGLEYVPSDPSDSSGSFGWMSD